MKSSGRLAAVPSSQVKKEIENDAGDPRLPSRCPGALRPGPTAELCVMTTLSTSRLNFTVVLAGGGSSASLNRPGKSSEFHVLAATYPIGASPFDLPRTSELLDQAHRSILRSIDVGPMNRPIKRSAPTAPSCSATLMPGAVAPLAAAQSVQSIIASQRAWHSG
jgi:hypothetical protein